LIAVAAIGRVGKESREPIPVFPRIAVYAAAASSWRKGSRRSKIRMTCTDDHSPPRAVGMHCSLSPSAMALRVVFPAACSSLMIGARSASLASMLACHASADSLHIRAVGITPRKPPSFVPRCFAACSAALVLSEMRFASSWADRAWRSPAGRSTNGTWRGPWPAPAGLTSCRSRPR